MKCFEKEIARLLDKHAKITRITSYSKRWWNNDVTKARKIWRREKKKFGSSNGNRAKLKKARNIYYRVIRKVKRVCWQKFLQGEDENTNLPEAGCKNRCWTALRYTKPLQFKTNPALKDGNGNIATSMKAKKLWHAKPPFHYRQLALFKKPKYCQGKHIPKSPRKKCGTHS